MSAKRLQWRHWKEVLHRRIWQSSFRHEKGAVRWLLAFLRVCSISYTVFMETAAASRAAALSFNSVLGLGPLVAITVLVAGFVLGAAFGLVLGALIGQFPLLERTLYPYVVAFQTLPKVAIAPIRIDASVLEIDWR